MLMLFDLDDTLVHRRAVFSSWAEEFASQYPEQSGLAAWLTAEDQDGLRPREELWSGVKTRLSLDLPVWSGWCLTGRERSSRGTPLIEVPGMRSGGRGRNDGELAW